MTSYLYHRLDWDITFCIHVLNWHYIRALLYHTFPHPHTCAIRFHKLVWSAYGIHGAHPSGLIIGGSDNGTITMWSADRIIRSETAPLTISMLFPSNYSLPLSLPYSFPLLLPSPSLSLSLPPSPSSLLPSVVPLMP